MRLQYLKFNTIPAMETKHLDFEFNIADCEIFRNRNLKSSELHTHFFDEIAIILGGSAVHVVGKEKYPLIRGDVFVVHGEQKHGHKKLHKFDVLNIIYKKSLFSEIEKELEDQPGFNTLFVHEPCFRKFHKFKARLHLNPHQLNFILGIIDQMVQERDSRRPGFKKTIEYLFRILIINLCRCYEEIDAPHSKKLFAIGRVIDFMEEKFAEEITLSTLANHASTSESTFARAFKNMTGCTPIDYLIRLRVEKAAEMMEKNSDIRVIDVSAASGFCNSSYFTRKFKAIIGMSPMEYLKKRRGSE